MIDWNDNAKAAVRAYANFMDDYEFDVNHFFESVSPAQAKTVAESIPLTQAEIKSGMDRVVWAENLIKQLPVDHDGRNSWLLNYGSKSGNKTVADAVEQEGEKWTHTIDGDKCYVKVSEPDFEGFIVVVTEDSGYILCQQESLKPIKPTISKTEAWDKLNETKCSVHEFGTKLIDLQKEYDII